MIGCDGKTLGWALERYRALHGDGIIDIAILEDIIRDIQEKMKPKKRKRKGVR
jgi:hypothetical protein